MPTWPEFPRFMFHPDGRKVKIDDEAAKAAHLEAGWFPTAHEAIGQPVSVDSPDEPFTVAVSDDADEDTPKPKAKKGKKG